MKMIRGVTASVVVIYALISTSLIAQEVSTDKDLLQLFSNYPKSESLDYFVMSHGRREWLDKHHKILYTTWFLGGNPRVAMQCIVDESGKVSTVRDVYNWALQGSRSFQLTDQQLTLLQKDIETLPASAQSPPLAFLLIVSLKEKGKWTTRIYDRSNMPDELKEIYKITGAEIDITK